MLKYERDEMDKIIAQNIYLQTLVQMISDFYENLIDKYVSDKQKRKEIISNLIKTIAKGSNGLKVRSKMPIIPNYEQETKCQVIENIWKRLLNLEKQNEILQEKLNIVLKTIQDKRNEVLDE